MRTVLQIASLLMLSLTVRAGDRVALVIENTEYGGIEVAPSPASAVAKALEAKGFKVQKERNLNGKELESALPKFLRSTPTNSTAVVHFSGLGLSYLSGQQKARMISLVGVGDIKDKRSAQSADYEIGQRLFDMMAKELAAKRTYFVFDFAELGEGMEELETPAEAHLNELNLPEGVSYHVSYTQALKEIESQLPDQKFPFVASETAGDGKRPGERWVNGSGMVFSWCPPGKFKMGLEGSKDAEPVDVEITKGFWISTYELTQRDYRIIRGRDADKGALRHHPRAPITHVGNGSPGYAKALTEREQKAGRLSKDWEYRVPTEAQWEYACRAGTSTRYSFGDSPSDLYKYANFADRSLYEEDPGFYYALRDQNDGIARNLALVGSYEPNSWGIHDMHGNVSEWCREVYFDSLPGGADPFPQKETKSSKKVVRGGAWCSLSEYCQSGFRSSYDTGNNTEKPEWLGVRFVLVRK